MTEALVVATSHWAGLELLWLVSTMLSPCSWRAHASSCESTETCATTPCKGVCRAHSSDDASHEIVHVVGAQSCTAGRAVSLAASRMLSGRCAGTSTGGLPTCGCANTMPMSSSFLAQCCPCFCIPDSVRRDGPSQDYTAMQDVLLEWHSCPYLAQCLPLMTFRVHQH